MFGDYLPDPIERMDANIEDIEQQLAGVPDGHVRCIEPDDDEPFTLQNDRPKQPKQVFDERPKAKQLPLLRGLDDEAGQEDLFPDMTAT